MSVFCRAGVMKLSRFSNAGLKSIFYGRSKYVSLQVCFKSDSIKMDGNNCGYDENATIYDSPQPSLKYKTKDIKPKGVYIHNDVYDEDYYAESTNMIYNENLKRIINDNDNYIDNDALNDDKDKDKKNDNIKSKGYDDYVESVENSMNYDWTYKYLKKFKDYAKNQSFIKQLHLNNNDSIKRMDANYDETVTIYDCPQESLKHETKQKQKQKEKGVYINNDVYDEDYYLESTNMIYNENLKKIIGCTDNYVSGDYLNDIDDGDDKEKDKDKDGRKSKLNKYDDYIKKVESRMNYEWSYKYLKQFKEYAKNTSFMKQLHL